MPDFLLELRSEEIPARMQAAAADQLLLRFGDGLRGKLPPSETRAYATPRRLAIYATGLGATGNAASEERRGPRTDAPAAAIEGFLRSTGLTRDALEERDTPKGRFFYATIHTPGRPAAELLAELIPQIVRDFDWPKSMRWGDASCSTASPRWVRPLSGIVALLDDAVIPFEAAGFGSGRTTRGHRFMSTGELEIPHAAAYADTLRAAHVILDPAERATIIVDQARALAAARGLALVEDDALARENAGLTEWPVPLLGDFDPAFLAVPPEIVRLTMRTNQKYFALTGAAGALAPAFVCVANLAAPDGGAAILAGNRKVLAARLSDAKFFWDADVAKPLAQHAAKLSEIVFHEKLGTVADKVERVAKLARWLIESGAVPGADPDLAERAARLAKADLTTATVGEFPELQGVIGRHLALAQGEPAEVADAIRDHYKPVGPTDTVPTAPISVAVALADKLDTLVAFLAVGEAPTGSRDPFALRRAANGLVLIILANEIQLNITLASYGALIEISSTAARAAFDPKKAESIQKTLGIAGIERSTLNSARQLLLAIQASPLESYIDGNAYAFTVEFIVDRLKVQQRDAGVRPDIIDAVFALGGVSDLVRLLARVRAVQSVLATPDGANLLAGVKRAANILRIEAAKDGPHDGPVDPALLTEPAEIALHAQLSTSANTPSTAAETSTTEAKTPSMTANTASFEAELASIAALRPAIDAFFDTVIVNAPDPAIRRNRLALLARLRAAAYAVADFSKIEG